MKQSLQILRGSQILPSLIHYLLSQITSHQGLHKILIFIVYELLRLKLPALLRVLQTFSKYQNGQTSENDDKNNYCNNSSNTNQSSQQLPQHSYSPGDKADRLKILAEVQRKFFEDEWKAHADEIKEEVVHLFNIEKHLSELNRTQNIEKKEQQWETLKRDALCFIPYSIVSSTLLITTHFLHQLLNTKHSHYLTHNFPALHDPQEIARSLLHDFMEQTQLAGLKNVKAYFKQKLTSTLHHLPVQEVFNLETIFEYLDEYFLGTLLRSNSQIKRPSDHRKRSSMTLFRNGRRKSLNSSCNNNSNSPSSSQFFGQHVNFTDFNEIVNFSKFSSKYCSDHQYETVNAALFAGSQPIVAQRAMLDIMYLFLGDVSENKILTDSEFVEKHIEIADCKCREQRYQPSLQCIPEDEGDDDGYESDKSDQPIYKSKKGRNHSQNVHNNGYQIKDKTGNGQTEKMKNQIAALTKRRKYSFENDENQQEAPSKPPRRRKLSEEDQELLIQQQKTTQQKEQEEAGYNDDVDEHDGEEEGLVEEKNGNLKNINQPAWKTSKKDKQITKNSESKELNSKVKSPKVDYFQHLEYCDDIDEDTNGKNLESLQQHRFLSQEVAENEKHQKKQSKSQDSFTQNVFKNTNKGNKESSSSRTTKENNKSQKFDMNLVDFQQHIEDQDIDEDEDNQEESNVYYSKLSKNSSSLDEEDIAENRSRLSQFVQSLCSEAVEIISSVNFQSYLYYTALFQYSKLKNRVRLQVQENNGSKHMSLQNFLVLAQQVINEHFLDSDAPDKGKNVYKQARQDAQSYLNSQQGQFGHKHNVQNNHQHHSNNQATHQNNHNHNSANSNASAAVTKNKLILLKLLLDEIEQSRTIRQSFEQLTHFFALS